MTKEFKPGRDYREIKFVSRGSVGEVYRAVCSDGQEVAIKRLRPHLFYDRSEIEKLQHETKVLRAIDYPAFPRLIDCVETEEERFLVTEWLEGRSIEVGFQEFADVEEKEKRILHWSASFLRALRYLQKLPHPELGGVGLIHGDLSPRNVLVGKGESVKIFDFSHSVWLAESERSKGGTWGYMSLQQLEHRRVSVQTDLYSLGLLIVEILSGKPALEGKTRFQVFLSAEDLNPEQTARKITQNQILKQLIITLLYSTKREINPTEECLSLIEKFNVSNF